MFPAITYVSKTPGLDVSVFVLLTPFISMVSQPHDTLLCFYLESNGLKNPALVLLVDLFSEWALTCDD